MTPTLTVSTVPPVQPNHMLVVTMSDDDRAALHAHPVFGPLAAYWSINRTVYLRAGKVSWLYPLACSADWPWEFLAAGSEVPGSLEVQPSVSAELLRYRLDARDLWDARCLRARDNDEDCILERMDDAWRKCTSDECSTSDAWLRRDELLWLRWLDADAHARGDDQTSARARNRQLDIVGVRLFDRSPFMDRWHKDILYGGPSDPAGLLDLLTRHLLEP